MQPELALKAISHFTIAISIFGLLFVLLIAQRKELTGEPPLRRMVYLDLGVLLLCSFIALTATLYRAKRIILPHSHSHRLDIGHDHSRKLHGNYLHTDKGPNYLT